MSIKEMLESAAHAVWVPGDEKLSTAAPAKGATPSFTSPGLGNSGTAPTAAPSPFLVPGSVALDEGVYQKVLAKTNFETTPACISIHKYYDAMEGMPMDIKTKFKMAIAQAAKLDGLTADKILATFDGLKTALAADANNFAKFAEEREKTQITSRQTKIQQITDQITALETQHTQLAAELADEQNKHVAGTTQYALAQQRRATEIDQQKAEFAALLSH